MEYKLLPTFYEAAQYARKCAFNNGVVTSVKRATSGWVVVPIAPDSCNYIRDNVVFDPLNELDEICRTLPLRELQNELYLSSPDSKERAIISAHVNLLSESDSDDRDYDSWYGDGIYYFDGTLYVDHHNIGAVYYLDDGRGDPNTHVLTVHPPNEAALQEVLEELELVATRDESAPDIRLECWDWSDNVVDRVYLYNRIISVEEDSYKYMIDGPFVTSDLIVTLEFDRAI